MKEKKPKVKGDDSDMVLGFYVSLPRKGDPDTPKHRRRTVRLPRPAAVEVARFMFNFIPSDFPLMFSVEDAFMDKLTAAERIYIECDQDRESVSLDEIDFEGED